MTDTEYILLTLLQSGQVKPEHVYAGYVCTPGAVMEPQIADEVLIYLSHFRAYWTGLGSVGSKASTLSQRAQRSRPYKPGTNGGKFAIYYDVFPSSMIERLLEHFPDQEPHILHSFNIEDVLGVIGVESEPYGAEDVLESLLDRREVSSADVTNVLRHWHYLTAPPISSIWGMAWFVQERSVLMRSEEHPFYKVTLPAGFTLRILRMLEALPPYVIRHTYLYRHIQLQAECLDLFDILGD